jgi:enoyl-CoA hydratase/carnithine racemase
MSFVDISREDGIATVVLGRGKVNALNLEVVRQLRQSFENLEKDDEIKGVILTGRGKFFSFGFDIPEFLEQSREQFSDYLTAFTDLYTYLFLFPKPLVAALNGHTVAGGCMLATTCDYRLMVSGKAKISLNEVTFGASVFAGSVAMLKRCVGDGNAGKVLLTGKMFNAGEARELGLVDQVCTEDSLMTDAMKTAREFAARDTTAFGSIKRLLRRPIVEDMIKREKESIREFVDIWYSEATWKQLQEIKIHS